MTSLFRRKIDLAMITPTSKMTLKISCLEACHNDVESAKQLYDFLAGDMQLPDTDPVRPNIIGQVRQGAEDVFGWIQNHREDLMQGYQFIQNLRGKSIPSANVPPIPNE